MEKELKIKRKRKQINNQITEGIIDILFKSLVVAQGYRSIDDFLGYDRLNYNGIYNKNSKLKYYICEELEKC